MISYSRDDKKGLLTIGEGAELILGSFGSLQSIFLAIYVAFTRRPNTKNILLTLFFALITLRIFKSLAWVYLESVPGWFLNLGFAAHSASGPMLFLYLLYFLRGGKWNWIQLLHFIPSTFLVLTLFSLTESNFWYRGGYTFLLYQQLFYTVLFLSALVYSLTRGRHLVRHQLTKKQRIWLAILAAGAISIQLAYFSNYILGLTPYLTGPTIYGIIIFPITLFAVTNPEVFETRKTLVKYRNIQISDIDFDRIKQRILVFMNEKKPFLSEDFSLEALSKNIKTPKYLTSHVINKGFSTNFSDFINAYRIKQAKAYLLSNRKSQIKIAEIAHECGFNSLSAFNAAFKKHTGCTPSKFRDKSS